jgi:hypothetical protein
MATQADFANLDQLNLLEHGDSLERFYWPMVSASLSEYETFWRAFIVLLTNRVNPLACSDWVMVRPCLEDKYESLLMANYSTFYHCVVANTRFEAARKAKNERGFSHPELFFFSAKACIDNLLSFREQAHAILREAGIVQTLPASPKDLFEEISSYRNVFAHRPLLGRGSHHGREMILEVDRLPSRDDPFPRWSSTMTLSSTGMTDSIDYQAGLLRDLAAYLQRMWKAFTVGFTALRIENAFIDDVALRAFLPIYGSIGISAIPSATNPFAASGALVFDLKNAGA